MALLHGHSYSAHAMGCTAVVKAIQWFKDPCTNINFEPEGKKLKEVCGISFCYYYFCCYNSFMPCTGLNCICVLLLVSNKDLLTRGVIWLWAYIVLGGWCNSKYKSFCSRVFCSLEELRGLLFVCMFLTTLNGWPTCPQLAFWFTCGLLSWCFPSLEDLRCLLLGCMTLTTW